MTKLTIKIPDDLSQFISSKNEKEISKLMVQACYDELYGVHRYYEPNKETVEVLKQSRLGIGLNEYSAWGEMIKKIKKEIDTEL